MEVVYKELKNKLRPLQRPQIVSNRWTMRAKTLNEILIQQQHTIQTKLPNNTFSPIKNQQQMGQRNRSYMLDHGRLSNKQFQFSTFSPSEEENLSLNSLNFELFSPDPTRPPAIASSNIKFTTFFAFQPIMLQQLLKCLFFCNFLQFIKEKFCCVRTLQSARPPFSPRVLKITL